MENQASFEKRLDRIGEHLDQLAARATRSVAEFRSLTESLLYDLEAWRAQLDQARVDAELARMDARDELGAVRSTLKGRCDAIDHRLEFARQESAAAWAALRTGIDEAVRDLRRAFEPTSSAPT